METYGTLNTLYLINLKTMILTKDEILKQWRNGEIIIKPFDENLLNPNSYNYRLSDTILQISNDEINNQNIQKKIPLGKKGYVLKPGHLYLGTTLEIIGSKNHVTLLLGRSSIGRLGLFLNITADLGHFGAISNWTLELAVVQPLRIYPFMRIGQVSFWIQEGQDFPYSGRYQGDQVAFPNKDGRLLFRENL